MYRRLADQGLVDPLKCSTCKSELISMLGDDDEPTFWCAICDTRLDPGLDMYDQMNAAIKEHSE